MSTFASSTLHGHARRVPFDTTDLIGAVAACDLAHEQVHVLQTHISRSFDGIANIRDDQQRTDAFWSVSRNVWRQCMGLVSENSVALIESGSSVGRQFQVWSSRWPWSEKMRSEIGPRFPANVSSLTTVARAHHELCLFNLALATVNQILWHEASRAYSFPMQRYTANRDAAYPFWWPDGCAAVVELGPNPAIDPSMLARIEPFVDPDLTDAERGRMYRHNIYCRLMREEDLVQPEERALIGQWGVFAKRRIPEGECLGVYGGTLLDHESTIALADRRHLANVSSAAGPEYCVNGENITSLMNTRFTFDAHGRIVAQSEESYNVRPRGVEVSVEGGIPLSVITFFAACEIDKDTELRWNYGYAEAAIVKNGLRD